MVTLVVTFCMTLNPTMCRTIEMVPVDHSIVSVPECIRGGAIGGMAFELEHIEWHTKGWRCVERENPVQAWMKGN
jgi:hypothetical protein